jgi:hypothetical protein
MFVRRLATLRPARSTARDRKPRKSRAWRFIFITLGSGALAALIAIGIAGIPTVLSVAFPGDTPPQIDASAIFPPAQPVHKVVDVYDPPPRQAPRPSSVAPSRTSTPARPSPSARPSHPPDD